MNNQDIWFDKPLDKRPDKQHVNWWNKTKKAAGSLRVRDRVFRERTTLAVLGSGVRIPYAPPEKSTRKRAFFNEINPLRGFVKCASRVKYAFGVWNACGRGWIYFISLCGETAKFHVCRKANISHRAKARYFTEYHAGSNLSIKNTNPSFSYFIAKKKKSRKGGAS